ncbi:hypothetical protein QZH41_008915 [Actinostola sp. cb2023]|nr:hypothetical protein QZH41_008915 [Actinostola sp. cb2023]
MEPEIYKFRLRKNYTTIVRDLEPKKVLGYLYQDSIFDEDDMDEVRDERTRKKQAESLLSMLDRRGKEGYPVLVNALEETQPHLANILKTPIPNENLGETFGDLAVSKRTGRQTSFDELTNMLRNLNEPVEHPEPSYPQRNTTESGSVVISTTDANIVFVRPTNLDLISPLYRPHSLNLVYKMTSSPRGLAVIVNMNKFNPDPKKQVCKEEKLDEREGSDVDVSGLVELFEGLDFVTETLIDKTQQQLDDELLRISKNKFEPYDCFVLCIMSHGKGSYFYCSDGGKMEVSDVRKKFDNAHCESLCGKPKLFFIQACRGKSTDFGRTVSDAPSENNENENAESQADRPTFNLKRKTHKGPSTSENADILLAYSSVEGYTSYRNTGSGSRFIRSLVQIFQDYAGIEDVQGMLTRVINQVNSDGEIGSKQVPKPETTLTKKVFFWPGMRDFHC